MSWSVPLTGLALKLQRSYMELDVLFERKIPACKFASTVIEPEAEKHQMKATTQ